MVTVCLNAARMTAIANVAGQIRFGDLTRR